MRRLVPNGEVIGAAIEADLAGGAVEDCRVSFNWGLGGDVAG